ncbi:MAG: phosphatidate cytidylyltransferase, partial [bacterium TMED144]
FDHLNGSRFTLLLFITVWMTDSAAYFIGNAFGRTKMIESISPKKTIEGFIGGCFGSLFCVSIFNSFEVLNYSLSTFQIILISILIGIFGQLGDFFESMIKRNYKIKDSSNLLLGHGGFLDRFDSIIISSPLIFIFLRFIS